MRPPILFIPILFNDMTILPFISKEAQAGIECNIEYNCRQASEDDATFRYDS